MSVTYEFSPEHRESRWSFERPLTPEQVTEALAYIARIAGDDERAHGAEDSLHQAVLEFIATHQCHNPGMCAGEALKTKDIEFARWCA